MATYYFELDGSGHGGRFTASSDEQAIKILEFWCSKPLVLYREDDDGELVIVKEYK